MTSPIWVAIDTPDLERAQLIAKRVAKHVGGIKLGLEFFAANGRSGVHEMAKLDLPIFLDLKLHDIPNTVAKAVQALRPLDPAILTVHAAGGRAMMEDAKAAKNMDDLENLLAEMQREAKILHADLANLLDTQKDYQAATDATRKLIFIDKVSADIHKAIEHLE